MLSERSYLNQNFVITFYYHNLLPLPPNSVRNLDLQKLIKKVINPCGEKQMLISCKKMECSFHHIRVVESNRDRFEMLIKSS